jgi:transcriptional regulator with XRE-family HTH domain
MSLFSKNLRFLRKKGNHNQDEISILFNKRANTIGNWENQKSEPNLAELMKLGEYFKVSIQDLLHSDLEKQSEYPVREQRSEPATMEAGSAGISRPMIRSHSIQESEGGMVRESGPDAFWLILRELRAIGEKVDKLVSGMESTGFKKSSDKSYH